MAEYKYRIKTKDKLHIRPCTLITGEAVEYRKKYRKIKMRLYNASPKGYQCASADPSSMIEMMAMGIAEKQKIDIIVSGKYEKKILKECAEKIGKLLMYKE